jgi:two-component system, chemotaxis family, chemotaxis protein CheY
MASILAVDDSYSMRQAVSLTLEGGGHEVVTAEDGLAALQVAGQRRFDLVLTDLMMPRMDGISLVAELRKRPEFQHTPLLMLTTQSDDACKRAGKAAGASGWIVKPFGPDQLLDVVEQMLRRRDVVA